MHVFSVALMLLMALLLPAAHGCMCGSPCPSCFPSAACQKLMQGECNQCSNVRVCDYNTAPTLEPTKLQTTDQPTPKPVRATEKPTPEPTKLQMTDKPTPEPTMLHTTDKPTSPPESTKQPTSPDSDPNNAPTREPTEQQRDATRSPTPQPSAPTTRVTSRPTPPPTAPPRATTAAPTRPDTPPPAHETTTPEPTTVQTTAKPTSAHTRSPTREKTESPTTRAPTRAQTAKRPTPDPTPDPTPKPTSDPTAKPTQRRRTSQPTALPTSLPSSAPTQDLCANGLLDAAQAAETDVDCGGDVCAARCEVLQRCLLTSDCAAGLLCGFADLDAGDGGLCMETPPQLATLPECGPSLPCPNSAIDDDAATPATVVCALLPGAHDRGVCAPLEPGARPPAPADPASGEMLRWTAAEAAATGMVALGLSVGAVLADPVLCVGMLEVAQAAAAGAQLVLPSAPAHLVRFAASLNWINGAFLPLSAAPARVPGAPAASGTAAGDDGGGGRRELADDDDWRDLGLARLAAVTETGAQYMLLWCLAAACATAAALVLARVVLSGRDALPHAVKDAAVRVPYYFAYPVTALCGFTVYELFVVRSLDGSVSAAARGALAALVAAVACGGLAWAALCARHSERAQLPRTKSATGRTPFASLLADWRPSRRRFWAVKAGNSVAKGLFVGLVVTPAPLQSGLFLACTVVYLAALLVRAPYTFTLANRVAVGVAVMCVACALLPVLLAMPPHKFDERTRQRLGDAQIALSLACIAGMLCVVLAQAAARWLARAQEAPSVSAAAKPTTHTPRKGAPRHSSALPAGAASAECVDGDEVEKCTAAADALEVDEPASAAATATPPQSPQSPLLMDEVVLTGRIDDAEQHSDCVVVQEEEVEVQVVAVEPDQDMIVT